MKKRATGTGRKQEKTPVTMSVAMQQLMLPLLLAMDATKKGLLSFVQQMRMVALSELLATEPALMEHEVLGDQLARGRSAASNAPTTASRIGSIPARLAPADARPTGESHRPTRNAPPRAPGSLP